MTVVGYVSRLGLIAWMGTALLVPAMNTPDRLLDAFYTETLAWEAIVAPSGVGRAWTDATRFVNRTLGTVTAFPNRFMQGARPFRERLIDGPTPPPKRNACGEIIEPEAISDIPPSRWDRAFDPLRNFFIEHLNGPYWRSARVLLLLVAERIGGGVAAAVMLLPLFAVLAFDALLVRERRINAFVSPSPWVWAWGGAVASLLAWVSALALVLPYVPPLACFAVFIVAALLFWFVFGRYHRLG